MRLVEHTIDGEDAVAIQAALNDIHGSEGTLWSKEIELGENLVVDLKVCGGGKDEPWIDVVLFEKTEQGLSELYPLEVQDSPFGEFVFQAEGVTLKVVDGATFIPAP